jgi:hypothetical protein
MRVSFKVSGGIAAFPGLAAPRTIDVDALHPDERASLERLIQDARFFDLPSRLPPPRGAADYQSYEITIEDGPRTHSVVVSDPVSHQGVPALVARLRQLTLPRH